MEKFDFNTIENFDEHISKSIPGYDQLIEHVLNISTFFIKEDSRVYDFGCSTGNTITKLKKKHHNYGEYIGVDKAENMAKCQDFIVHQDLNQFKIKSHDFSMLLFTLQFLKLHTRYNLLNRIYNALNDQGALIVAEKVILPTGYVQDLFTFSYYDNKLKYFNGFNILSKQYDLRSMMNPISEEQNIQMFKEVGFITIQKFWQSLQFNAWILLKT